MFRKKRQKRRKPKRQTLQFERLERREMLDATGVAAELFGDVLTITGTDMAETIDVRHQADKLQVHYLTRDAGLVVNRGSFSFAAQSIAFVEIYGEAGDDYVRITGQTGSPNLRANIEGGDGNDTIEANQVEAILTGGPGIDRLFGRFNGVAIDYSGADAGVEVDLLRNRAMDDGDGSEDYLRNVVNVDGSPFSDTILGNRSGNSIHGYGGDDELHGFRGANTISGGDDNDRLFGGADVDALIGGSGNDFIAAGSGDDVVYAGIGDDVIETGAGNDYVDAGTGDDHIETGDGSDTILGSYGNDTIYAGSDADFVDGGDGNDTIHGEAGDDVLKGGDGSDLLHGSSGDDLLLGGAEMDDIYGGVGRDVTIGGPEEDNIYSGPGDGTAGKGTGGSLTTGSGLVQIIDDDGVPDITPEFAKSTALRSWLDAQFSTNKTITINEVNATNQDLANLASIKLIKRLELLARGAMEQFQKDIELVQAVVKTPALNSDTRGAAKYDTNGNDVFEDSEIIHMIQVLQFRAPIIKQLVLVAALLGGSNSGGGTNLTAPSTGIGPIDDATGADGDGGGIPGTIGKWSNGIGSAINNPAAVIAGIRNQSLDLTNLAGVHLSTALADLDDITNIGLPNIITSLTLPDSNVFGSFTLPSTLALPDLDSFFDGISLQAINKGLSDMPLANALGNLPWDASDLSIDPTGWWQTHVEIPFNTYWQNKIEPAWHNAEVAWHNWVRHVSGFDWNHLPYQYSQIDEIRVERDGPDHYAVIVSLSQRHDVQRVIVEVKNDTASDVTRQVFGKEVQQSGVDIRVRVPIKPDGTIDTVRVRVKQDGKIRDYEKGNVAFPFHEGVIYSRTSSSSGGSSEIDDLAGQLDDVVLAHAFTDTAFQGFYYFEINVPRVPPGSEIEVTARNDDDLSVVKDSEIYTFDDLLSYDDRLLYLTLEEGSFASVDRITVEVIQPSGSILGLTGVSGASVAFSETFEVEFSPFREKDVFGMSAREVVDYLAASIARRQQIETERQLVAAEVEFYAERWQNAVSVYTQAALPVADAAGGKAVDVIKDSLRLFTPIPNPVLKAKAIADLIVDVGESLVIFDDYLTKIQPLKDNATETHRMFKEKAEQFTELNREAELLDGTIDWLNDTLENQSGWPYL